MESAIISVKDRHLLQKSQQQAPVPSASIMTLSKKQSEQVCQDEVNIYMTHLEHINNLGSPESIPRTPNKTQTEPIGESNPVDTKPEDY